MSYAYNNNGSASVNSGAAEVNWEDGALVAPAQWAGVLVTNAPYLAGATFAGVQGYGGQFVIDWNPPDAREWDVISNTFLAQTSGTAYVDVFGYTNAGYNNFDAVSVVCNTCGVPEPPTWAIAIIGLMALFAMRRFKAA